MANVSCHENRSTHRFCYENLFRPAHLVVKGDALPARLLNYSAGGFLIEIDVEEILQDDCCLLITEEEEVWAKVCHQQVVEKRLQIGLKRIKSVPRNQVTIPSPFNHQGNTVTRRKSETDATKTVLFALAFVVMVVGFGVMINYRPANSEQKNGSRTLSRSYANHSMSSKQTKPKTFYGYFSSLISKKKTPQKRSITASTYKPRNSSSPSSSTRRPNPPTARSTFTLELPLLTNKSSKTENNNQSLINSVPEINLSHLFNVDSQNMEQVESLLTGWVNNHLGESFVFQLSGSKLKDETFANISLELDYDSTRQLADAVQATPEKWNRFLDATEEYLIKQKKDSLLENSGNPVRLPPVLVASAIN